MFLVYEITPSKVTIRHGLIEQTHKNVHFVPLGYIPEINMEQDRIQRLLNYGTIFVHGSAQNSFEIKDIDHPKKILKLIEELIEKNRLGRDGEDEKRSSD
jgi:membrane protein YdbS with pleckstrin-like domain